MNDVQQLHVYYDYRSKTVLVEFADRSHVLAERFEDNESAQQAAIRYAVTQWGYRMRIRKRRVPLCHLINECARKPSQPDNRLSPAAPAVCCDRLS